MDWRKNVELLGKYSAYRDEIIYMMDKLDSIWDGHIGRIKEVKHRIELTLETDRPIHISLYPAGPAARQFQKWEIDKMVAQGVIEPSET